MADTPDKQPVASGLAYSAIAAIRNTEGSLRWQGAQLGFILNIPGWVGAAIRLTSSPKTTELAIIFVGCTLFACANWFLREIIRRDSRLMEFWNDSLVAIERKNGIQGGVKIFTSTRYQKLRKSRDRIHGRLLLATDVSIVMWILIAMVALGMLIRGVSS